MLSSRVYFQASLSHSGCCNFGRPSGTHPKLTLRWRHNGRDGVLNYPHHHSVLNRLFRRRSKKMSKLRVAGLCVENSPVNGEFPAQMASNTENVTIWWCHNDCRLLRFVIAFIHLQNDFEILPRVLQCSSPNKKDPINEMDLFLQMRLLAIWVEPTHEVVFHTAIAPRWIYCLSKSVINSLQSPGEIC